MVEFSESENCDFGAFDCYIQKDMAAYFKQSRVEYIPDQGVRCQIDGVLESVCVPVSTLKSEVKFCYDDLYDHVCKHVYHPLWSEWTVEEKDFEIQKQVCLNAEQRLIQELTQNTFSEEY